MTMTGYHYPYHVYHRAKLNKLSIGKHTLSNMLVPWNHVSLNDCANLMRRDFLQYAHRLSTELLWTLIFQTNEDMQWKTHGFPDMRLSIK